MEETFKDSINQAAAFQKMWMNSMSEMAKVWSEYSPHNPPPDELKKLRSGVLKAVSQTWEEYMRSPEFMAAMRDAMNNSLQWKKMAKESTNQMHSAMGSATKDDVQGVMEAVQHVEHRLLDHLEGMQSKMEDMQSELKGLQTQTTQSLDRYQETILKHLKELNKGLKASAKTVAAKRTTVRKSPSAKGKERTALKKTPKTKTAKTKAHKK